MPNESEQGTFYETLFADGNLDVLLGFITLFIGGLLSLSNYQLGVFIGSGLALYFAFSCFGMLAGGGAQGSRPKKRFDFSDQKPEAIPSTSSAPLTDDPTLADKIKDIHTKYQFKCPSCGAVTLPTDMVCKHCGSVLVEAASLPRPLFFGDVQVGQSIRIDHPTLGKVNATVKGRVYYGELWQERMRQNVPWTLTGNYFIGLLLESDSYLLNWQSRFYYLGSRTSISDSDINLHFAQAARKFAASNQTADTQFTYKGEPWKIDDIGRFRVEYNEGGSRAAPGAAGRFIHASHFNRVLVVEDYQSGGGGLDACWWGHILTEKDIEL